MPDWKSPETLERLLAAVIAASGCKVDNMAVARYFNDTYDTIENRTRVYKKQAQALIKEAEDAGRMEMNMRKGKGGGGASPAPRKKKDKDGADLHSVASGRVAKTPAKKSALKKSVKQKEIDDSPIPFPDIRGDEEDEDTA